MMRLTLQEVEQISDFAHTAAVVLTYVTIGTLGYRCRNKLTSSAVIEAASGQRAFRSGMSIVFSELNARGQSL
jgi:hypothetical protein